MRTIDAATLRDWSQEAGPHGVGELAILDAREEGAFAAGHLFWAVPCPLSRRELRARAVLPRPGVRTVCVDGGAGEARALAAWLTSVGYTDISVLHGGVPAWAQAGQEVFTGVNVPSKAFGEWVEHHYGTESIDATELKSWQDDGRKLAILDSRPLDEFKRMSIPGGINVPGGELVYRFADLVPDPDTTVVVNCAGRTRSILGAESLRRAGVPNRVVALRNGTMGWELAGLPPARGQTDRYPPGTPPHAAAALAPAADFATRAGVPVMSATDLAEFTADPAHSCYVLDVRDPAEFVEGHRPRSVSAPGGQLVQATDQWIAARGARIALIDNDGVRARMTAAWLRLMGHRDVVVVDGALAGDLEVGEAPPAIPELAAPVETIDADTLAAAPDALVLDFARSTQFRDGHIPGATWCMRTRLVALKERIAGAKLVVATSPDGVIARLAMPELQALARGRARWLNGGTLAWKRAAGKLERDRRVPPDEDCVDVWLRPYDRNTGVEAAMRDYLSWEIDLVKQIAREGVVFGV